MSYQGPVVNWGDSEKKEYKALPNGNYHATVTGCTLSETNGEQTFEFEFTVTDSDYANRKLWDKANVAKVAWKVKKNFKALGVWPNQDPTDVSQVAPLCAKVLNKPVEVKVTSREYNGKIYNNAEPVRVLDSTATEEDLPF